MSGTSERITAGLPGVESVAVPTRRALLIVNPVAPNLDAEALRQALVQAFDRRGGSHRVFETSNAADLPRQLDLEIARARQDGCEVVIAAGGDGTVSQVADALWRSRDANLELALAIVPLGTANVLARELGIPLDPVAAVTVAADRRRMLTIDAIGHDNKVFLTQVGIGLDASMIAETSRESQLKHGRLAYLMALMRKIAGHRSERFVIDVDGRRLRLRAWQVVVANAGTFGQPPFTWGPNIEGRGRRARPVRLRRGPRARHDPVGVDGARESSWRRRNHSLRADSPGNSHHERSATTDSGRRRADREHADHTPRRAARAARRPAGASFGGA
jgi:diacylglycerol kinase family enzyme